MFGLGVGVGRNDPVEFATRTDEVHGEDIGELWHDQPGDGGDRLLWQLQRRGERGGHLRDHIELTSGLLRREAGPALGTNHTGPVAHQEDDDDPEEHDQDERPDGEELCAVAHPTSVGRPPTTVVATVAGGASVVTELLRLRR